MQTIPKRFIQKNIVLNMKETQIAYIDKVTSIKLDTEYRLWVKKNTLFSQMRVSDTFSNGDENQLVKNLVFSGIFKDIKIEKTAAGYKLYLYEYFELLQQKKFECTDFNTCNNSECICSCEDDINRIRFVPTDLGDKADTEYLLITEFDKPKRNLDDAEIFQGITPETIKNFSEAEIEQIYSYCLSDENYTLLVIIQKERDRRKSG